VQVQALYTALWLLAEKHRLPVPVVSDEIMANRHAAIADSTLLHPSPPKFQSLLLLSVAVAWPRNVPAQDEEVRTAASIIAEQRQGP
jgi:hypothetical protein